MNKSIEIENCLNHLSKKWLQEKHLVHKIDNLIIANFFDSIAGIKISKNKFSYADKELIRITSNDIRSATGIPHIVFYKNAEEAFKAYKSTLFAYFKNEFNSKKEYYLEWIVLPRIRKYRINYIAYSVFRLKKIN